MYVKLFQKLYVIPLNSFSRVKFRTYSLKVCPCSVLYLLIYYINYNNSGQSCQKHGPSLHFSIPEPGLSISYSNSFLIFTPNKWPFLSFYRYLICAIFHDVLIFSVKSQIQSLFLSNFTLEVFYISQTIQIIASKFSNFLLATSP